MLLKIWPCEDCALPAHLLLAFVRSDISFHGLEPLSERDVAATAGRDVIQYVIHDKAAREAQLEARRTAAQEANA